MTAAHIPAWADYGPSTNPAEACRLCDFYSADTSRCERFEGQPRVEPQGWCNQFQGKIDKTDHMPTYVARAEDATHGGLSDQDKVLLSTAADQLEPDQILQKADTPKAAGIAVRAADTGRVLMIQRSNDARDRAAGTWEFPGGKMEDGEHPRQAAQREWQEEMGMRLPKGRHVGQWRSGVYQGFVHEVPSEDNVRINRDTDDRRVRNPDDPDGDQIEVAAWVHPRHMRRNSSLRRELRASRAWRHVEKADTPSDYFTRLTSTICKMSVIAAPGIPPYEPTVRKAPSGPAPLHLRVAGISRSPSGHYVYRMETRDGRYVGRTLPTRTRARKGEALKITPTAWSQDAQTDIHWVNPIVASSYTDAPHSWRELQALAGAHLEKDYAPGAEEAPPTQDQGGSALLSGPTLSAVHVAVPLPDLSQAYLTLPRRPKKLLQRREQENAQLEGEVESVKGNREVLVGEFLPVQKAGKMQQLVYGVVLEPNVMDSQNDFMLPRHVEATAHNYLKKAIRGQSSVVKLQHRKQGFRRDKPSIVPVESFIAPVDFALDDGQMVRKGSWVLCMHVEDPALWQRFLKGEFGAFSVGGSGIRQSIHAMPRPDQEPLGYIGNPPPGRWPEPRPSPGQLGAFV